MSLLLDALKKAADDKQKISDAESVEKQDKDAVENAYGISDKADIEKTGTRQEEKLEELTLELPVEDEAPGRIEEIDEPGLPELDPLSESEADVTATTTNNTVQQGASAEKFVISDDGLSLLIHKTNHDIKKSNRILMVAVAFVALLVLVAGGAFYYSDMQAEVASLERKHHIAMQAMQSKMNADGSLKKSAIIRNLVSEVDLDKKVQFAKKQISSDKHSKSSRTEDNFTRKKTTSKVAALSIQKTNAVDPVGEALESAWLSYEAGQYDDAKKSYKDVLSLEENNRDALLGLAAIAVLNKKSTEARVIYASLLELDPRDPIATAAIASLRSNADSLDSDENYLLSMLQKNPDAPHLNFSLANIYAQKNKWDSAQQYYFNAWQKDSENADYIFNLAVSMDQLNKKQQAVRFYKDSLLKAKNKQIHFSRDTVQKRINELSEL